MDIKNFACIFFLFLVPIAAECQTKSAPDSMPPHKNIVRIGLIQPLLFGSKNLILGYERVVKPNQSFSINAGLTSLPKVTSIDLDSLSATKDAKTTGWNVSADYRFYLKKENKFGAPRGVYIGPYAFYYNFERTNYWNLQTVSATTDFNTEMKLNIYGAGFELGYQFILWKRLALDLVLIGPGLARYSFEAKVNGNLDIDEESQVIDALKAWLDEKYPGANLVWGDKTLDAGGRVNTTSVGYRYLIHIGYYF